MTNDKKRGRKMGNRIRSHELKSQSRVRNREMKKKKKGRRWGREKKNETSKELYISCNLFFLIFV